MDGWMDGWMDGLFKQQDQLRPVSLFDVRAKPKLV
jgi:hypothetical protein